jgi:hypothetical protein
MISELNAIIADREYTTTTMFMNSHESAAEVTRTVLVGTKKSRKIIKLLLISVLACIIASAVFLTTFMSDKASVKKASETDVPKTPKTTKPKEVVEKDTPSARTASVNLGAAGNYAILSKSQISTVPNSVITGNIGVSPINSTAITGFSLTVDATNEFLCSTQINGKLYASDYDSPTSSNLTTAISNMETAYTDAAGRAVNYTELYTGDISGQTLTAGVYKWGTDVLINSDVTLHGGADDVWIFQIAKGITQANDTKIILTGEAQAKNIFWQSSETVAIGTNAHLEGIVLGKTNITMGTNASINGRLLAQAAVTLIKSTVVSP